MNSLMRTPFIAVLMLAVLIFSPGAGSDGLLGAARARSLGVDDITAIGEQLDRRGAAAVIVQLAPVEGENSSWIGTVSGRSAHAGRVRARQDRLLDRALGVVAGGRQRGIRRMALSSMMAMTVTEPELAALANDPDVVRVYADRLDAPHLQASVPLIGMTGSDGAYVQGADGTGTAVAILDTGVDRAHPFLSGKFLAEACFSNGGGKGIALCGNGQNRQEGAGAADAGVSSCLLGSRNICDHGTHVAGIAVGSNPFSGLPASGVARSAMLVALQVYTRFNDASTCGGGAPCVLSYTSDQIAALEWLLDHHDEWGVSLAAANLSLGTVLHASHCDDDPRKPIIDALRSAGIATVISSGNNGSATAVTAPACIASAITVGASSKTDLIFPLSNQAPAMVDVLAPGADIVSSVPGGTYRSLSGTSMAAPHVAGAFAAIRSLVLTESVDVIEEALKSSGKPVTLANGTASAPRIAVNRALELLMTNSGRTRQLSLTKSGEGRVVSTPAGIECGDVCAADFAAGAPVRLAATPAAGYRFSGWSGACAGLADCAVDMREDSRVTATFEELPRHEVRVVRTGPGRVISEPAGIECGLGSKACRSEFSAVTLTAQPGAGFYLKQWEGCPAAEGDACRLAPDRPLRVKARFARLPSVPLTVTKTRFGSVSSQPARLICRGAATVCSARFARDTQLELRALPLTDHVFVGWSGDCTGMGPCTMTMNAKRSVFAEFR